MLADEPYPVFIADLDQVHGVGKTLVVRTPQDGPHRHPGRRSCPPALFEFYFFAFSFTEIVGGCGHKCESSKGAVDLEAGLIGFEPIEQGLPLFVRQGFPDIQRSDCRLA
jgi:hypothetical protein